MALIYARHLFGLLKTLHISQQTVAQRLGASRSSVSLWARGHRGIPAFYLRPFFVLVADAIRHHQHNRAQHMHKRLSEWHAEVSVQIRRCTDGIQACFEQFQSPLATVDPLTLAPEARARLREIARVLMLHFDAIEALGNTDEPAPSDYPLTPLERLEDICWEFGIEEGKDLGA